MKPIDPEQLNEALDKAIQAWNKDEELRHNNRELNIEMNQIKPMYWDKLLSNLIAEPSPMIKRLTARERTSFVSDNSTSRVAILSLDTMKRSVKNKFSHNLDLLLYFAH